MTRNHQYEVLLIKRHGTHVFVVGKYRHREIWVRFGSQVEAKAWIAKQLAKQKPQNDPTLH